jgi:eukaryotic-like serine/threonine-protein kinase
MEHYHAMHKDQQREVRLTIRGVYDQDAARFLKERENEADVILSLAHPNLVKVLEINAEGGYVYVVAEWIDGEHLGNICGYRKPLPPQRVGKILGQIADALDYLHQHGIVHSGLNVFDILLGIDDHVYLDELPIVDRLTTFAPYAPSELVGSKQPEGYHVSYTAPERLVSEISANVRSDIYELGTVVYEMLTGDTPYKGETPFEIIQHKDREDPPPFSSDTINKDVENEIKNERKKDISGTIMALIRKPPISHPTLKPELSEDIKRIVAKAIARVPEQRFDSAGEFAAAFNMALSS